MQAALLGSSSQAEKKLKLDVLFCTAQQHSTARQHSKTAQHSTAVNASVAVQAARPPGGAAAGAGASEAANAKVGSESVRIANYLCVGNYAVSGGLEGCEAVEALAKGKGARMTVRLAVAGAFHTSYMQPAQEQLQYATSTPGVWPVYYTVMYAGGVYCDICCGWMLWRWNWKGVWTVWYPGVYAAT